jgi:hypothetical protein
MHLRMPLLLPPALMIFTTVFPLQLKTILNKKAFRRLRKARRSLSCSHLWFMNLALLPFIVPSTYAHSNTAVKKPKKTSPFFQKSRRHHEDKTPSVCRHINCTYHVFFIKPKQVEAL